MAATPTPPIASTVAPSRPRVGVGAFLRLWAVGLIHPTRAFVALGERPAPWWGLWAVAVRFVGTALTTTLVLVLLGRPPFTPPHLTFIRPDRHCLAEFFFLPVFGLATWLLMAGS